MARTRPDLLEHLDLASFLLALLEWRQREDPSYTRTALASELGYQTASAISGVISGSRAPSDRLLKALIEALALSSSEAGYLRLLAAQARCRTDTDRERSRAACERYRDTQRIEWKNDEAGLRALFGSYAARVVLALAELPGFQPDPAYIASRTFPPIDEEEAAEALGALLSLGALQPTVDGHIGPSTDRLHRFHAPPATAEERLAIGRAHLGMLHDAELQSLEGLQPPDRMFASLMIPIRASQLPDLQARLLEHIEALARRAHQDPDPDTILMLDLRLFTVARSS